MTGKRQRLADQLKERVGVVKPVLIEPGQPQYRQGGGPHRVRPPLSGTSQSRGASAVSDTLAQEDRDAAHRASI